MAALPRATAGSDAEGLAQVRPAEGARGHGAVEVRIVAEAALVAVCRPVLLREAGGREGGRKEAGFVIKAPVCVGVRFVCFVCVSGFCFRTPGGGTG